MVEIFSIKKGLNIPISGAPVQILNDSILPSRVALLGPDYQGLRPNFVVNVGDEVKTGQLLFTDKNCPAIRFTSPAQGKVIAINRGAKRAFLSLEIEVTGTECVTFAHFKKTPPENLHASDIVSLLVESGLWTALRTRPFSKIPDPTTKPDALFINAMDTNPLAPKPELIIHEKRADFIFGLRTLLRLTHENIHLCKSLGDDIPGEEIDHIHVKQFSGPHPAGLVGTHIHLLAPVGKHKTAWHLNYQDVIAIGHLFATGKIHNGLVVSVAGPKVKNPRLIHTLMGASTRDLTSNGLLPGPVRVISGSVLSGRKADGALAYLGRYHNQVSVIEEGGPRTFLGWTLPRADQFSVTRSVLGSWLPGKLFPMNTLTCGGPRSMVPIGLYEKVIPLDIEPTYLLRAILTGDIDKAVDLGLLELDEEDLALCTFVCPGKIEYAPYLRKALETFEKEG
jgi:Na+-transporting NADH:ubiquinone oxidoreductase subunit A